MIAKSIKADIVQSTHVRLATRAAPEVQVGLLTSRINELMPLKPRQGPSRRGLLRMVSRRRKLLDYLKSRALVMLLTIAKLGLRK
jgi:small subunit ribosomal protein S15